MSDVVLSGIPQGTVLASVLFIMAISDIDKELKESRIRRFPDETKVSKMIGSEENKQTAKDI